MARIPTLQSEFPPSVAQRALPSTLAVIGALVTVSLAFGGNFLAIRIVVHALPPFSLQAIRFLIAGIVLYAFASSRSHGAKPTADNGGPHL